MESVEIVRHFVRKHREVREQSGVGRFRGGMGAKERKGVSDDQSCPQMVASGLSRSMAINSLFHLFCH